MTGYAQVQALARAHGFEVVGVAEAAPLRQDLERLTAWRDAGHGADLVYMTRNPPQRADARTLLSGVRSVVSVAVPYGAPSPPFAAEARYGRVARYAWGRDYHDVVLPRLRAFGAALARALGGRESKAACDHSPILERAFAARGGMGFVGKNTCLIRPGHGSWFLLGEVLLDVDVPPAPPDPAAPSDATDGCGACTRCIAACPTGALATPFVLDARRCISYWTIETQAPIPRDLRSRLGAWVFGCDDCQTACPWNEIDVESAWPELQPGAGVGPRLDLAAVLALGDDEAWRRRFVGTALARSGRVGLARTAAIAARNVGATCAWGALVERARHDVAPVVRGHALWALAGLDPAGARSHLEHARRDPDPVVREEAEAALA
jgi:epoxyqueuosine reductase